VASVRDMPVVQAAYQQGFEEPLIQIDLYHGRKGIGNVTHDITYKALLANKSTGDMTVPVVEASPGNLVVGTLRPSIEAIKGIAVRLVAILSKGTLEEAITQIENENGLSILVDAIKTSLNGLTDLRILKLGGDFVAHARIGEGRPIPIFLLGDGAKRLIFLAAGIFAKKDEVVLLEEPEAFQHPRYLTEIVRLLVTYASKGAQYVLTTHSMEFVDLLLDELAAWKERGAEPPSLAVHRTRLVDGELYVTTLDGEQARVARQDLSRDLRG
jgi:hypothetical protein